MTKMIRVNTMKDAWQSSDPYEYYMGRWSRLVAPSFLYWLAPASELKWLDVGCGSGALSESILNTYRPRHLTAIDESEGFVRAVQKRLGDKVSCKVADALALPLENSSIDVAVSGLLMNFISEPQKALYEMYRVTNPGGTIGVYEWDYAGQMDFLTLFWDTAVELDPNASDLHEGKRFTDANAQALMKLFEELCLTKITTTPIDITTHFSNFDDFWNPFLGGQGAAPTYLQSLDDDKRDQLHDLLYSRIPIQTDGSIPMAARAWAVKGKV